MRPVPAVATRSARSPTHHHRAVCRPEQRLPRLHHAAVKSSGANSGLISMSESLIIGLGQRLTHSIASSIERTCHSQKPATSSLVSVNGPSVTVRLAPEKRTLFP